MELITNFNELVHNIETVEKYLSEKKSSKYHDILQLIKAGRSFIVYKKDNQIKFAPSRFLGYKNNTIEVHLNSIDKDGRKTNVSISKILSNKNDKNEDMWIFR